MKGCSEFTHKLHLSLVGVVEGGGLEEKPIPLPHIGHRRAGYKLERENRLLHVSSCCCSML